jgi:hypothetical protein
MGDLSGFLQAGFVGVFCAFVIWLRREEKQERLERNNNWQEFIRVQNAAICKGLEENTKALVDLMRMFEAHDKNTAEGFAVVLDRAKRVKTAP